MQLNEYNRGLDIKVAHVYRKSQSQNPQAGQRRDYVTETRLTGAGVAAAVGAGTCTHTHARARTHIHNAISCRKASECKWAVLVA